MVIWLSDRKSTDKKFTGRKPTGGNPLTNYSPLEKVIVVAEDSIQLLL